MLKNKKGIGFAGACAIILIAAIIAVVAFAVCWIVTYDINTYQITGTVQDARVVPSGNRDDPMSYVVYLTDGRKLEIKSNFWHNVNEDDIYFNIQANKTYTFDCWGFEWNAPFLGIYWYPNIVGVTEINPEG